MTKHYAVIDEKDVVIISPSYDIEDIVRWANSDYDSIKN
jgi:hypothetical protein